MPDSNLDRMLADAKAATQGKWYHRQAGMKSPRDGSSYDWIGDHATLGLHKKIIVGRESLYGGSVDYAHIANACPPTFIELIELVKEARSILRAATSNAPDLAVVSPLFARAEQWLARHAALDGGTRQP